MVQYVFPAESFIDLFQVLGKLIFYIFLFLVSALASNESLWPFRRDSMALLSSFMVIRLLSMHSLNTLRIACMSKSVFLSSPCFVIRNSPLL